MPWGSQAQSCFFLKEDSAAWTPGATCGLWREGRRPEMPWTISPWLPEQL